mmetsp:Transcript_15869/g.34805  ORF Transcript_15869/g.34805 Transcript_15869/m.34805 type:complete len:100 (+) Transcript_15869:591-890(+)
MPVLPDDLRWPTKRGIFLAANMTEELTQNVRISKGNETMGTGIQVQHSGRLWPTTASMLGVNATGSSKATVQEFSDLLVTTFNTTGNRLEIVERPVQDF